MSKAMMGILVLLTAFAATASAFTEPTVEQIAAAVQDPANIRELVRGATSEEAAGVVLGVIEAIDKLDIPLDQKQAKVAALVEQVRAELGDRTAEVMQIVARSVNPDLLPPIGVVGAPVAGLDMPVAQPLAPPAAPRYPGQ